MRQTGRTSQRLSALAETARQEETITVGDILGGMGPSGLGFTILILAIPALTPIPGPFGMVFGTCLALLSLQIMAGARQVRLPAIVARRKVPPAVMSSAARIAVPWVRRIETILKPGRLKPLTGRLARALIGLPVFLLAVAVALPIPFGNFLPVLALILISVALAERDGLMVLIALATSLVALAVSLWLVRESSAAVGNWAASW